MTVIFPVSNTLKLSNSPTGPILMGTQNGTPAMQVPIRLGSVGELDSFNVFDTGKMTVMADYKFDGAKGGDRWKTKVENHLISRVPLLNELLNYVERVPDQVIISRPLIKMIVGTQINDAQIEKLDNALWGFLNAGLHGEAEVIFKRASRLAGIDAWKKIVRHIQFGRPIRLENLRLAMKTLSMHSFKGLEQVATGIAAFENRHREYEEAGGRPTDDEEKKQ